jgi:hypothetical protein
MKFVGSKLRIARGKQSLIGSKYQGYVAIRVVLSGSMNDPIVIHLTLLRIAPPCFRWWKLRICMSSDIAEANGETGAAECQNRTGSANSLAATSYECMVCT